MFLDIWQVTAPFLVFLLGLFAVISLSRRFGSKDKRTLLLYFWHTLFTYVYYWFTINVGADASVYYAKALRGNVIFEPGTNFIVYLVSILTNYLHLNMMGCFLVFNLIGSLGLIILDSIIQPLVRNQQKSLRIIATLVIFLPSISFWSSGIGKDGISFLGAVLALWSALELKKRMGSMSIAILMMFLVRPHIAGIMIIALAVSLFFDKKVNIIMKLVLAFVTIGISAFLIPYALNYAGVNAGNSPDDIVSYIESREDVYKDTDSGITLSELSFPMKLFTYMFRPLIFEARSITQIFSALDNLILLYLFIFGGYKLIKKKNITSQENRKFMWSYVIIAWVILALTTGNLGIAVRQKVMVLPFLLFILISVMPKYKKN